MRWSSASWNPAGRSQSRGSSRRASDVQYAELVRRLESIDTRLAALAGGKGA